MGSVRMAQSSRARWWVLGAALGGLVFDGVELGLMPVASLSVSQDLLGTGYTAERGGDWFAWFTAALMLGAAIGGILLGHRGDLWGRSRALGISIVCQGGRGLWVGVSTGLGGDLVGARHHRANVGRLMFHPRYATWGTSPTAWARTRTSRRV